MMLCVFRLLEKGPVPYALYCKCIEVEQSVVNHYRHHILLGWMGFSSLNVGV